MLLAALLQEEALQDKHTEVVCEASIHRRDPTTERHGGFDLLRVRPGPVPPSLDDLVVPGSPRSTISIPNLVRTPSLQLRAPELKRSSSLSLPVTGITGAHHRTRREDTAPERVQQAGGFQKRFEVEHASAASCCLQVEAGYEGRVQICSWKRGRKINWGLMLLAALLQEEALQDKHTEVVCEGFTIASIHRRDPTTERHGGFDLLRVRPGPVPPSLDDLVVPGSPRSTISIPNLVRTPSLQLRAPELKRSSSLSLPVTGITGAHHRTRREDTAPERVQQAGGFQKRFEVEHASAASCCLQVEAGYEGRVQICSWKRGEKRDPTTERHGGFDLLRVRPGPVPPSLDDLVVPGSPRSTISIPNLVRTPSLQLRAPELKRSSSLSLPVTGITGARHRTRREDTAPERVQQAGGFQKRFEVEHASAASCCLQVEAGYEGRVQICSWKRGEKRDPTTERHGGFDLLRVRPGPVPPSLDDLVVPGSPRSTISIPNLVRTPVRHSPCSSELLSSNAPPASASR
ncbi:hypothetical protein NQZ68_019800 [Dissostichus eleginoides]|nr:hypothetical protein NQZ68_019800 [Dissostichus eleginoides]